MSTVYTVGIDLREARTSAGLTQRELAELAGVSRQWLVSVENGRRQGAELHRLLSVTRVLGLEVTFTPMAETVMTEAERTVLSVIEARMRPDGWL